MDFLVLDASTDLLVSLKIKKNATNTIIDIQLLVTQ